MMAGTPTTITGHIVVQLVPGTRGGMVQPYERTLFTSDSPIMSSALDAVPALVRRHGYGQYQIHRTYSDGARTKHFECVLIDS